VTALRRSLDSFNHKKPIIVADSVRSASRTDKGVHALRSAFTFDACPNAKDVENWTQPAINKYFMMNGHKARI
jgi:tRNA U38,U39,U40 pseudouridine synthase TruA